MCRCWIRCFVSKAQQFARYSEFRKLARLFARCALKGHFLVGNRCAKEGIDEPVIRFLARLLSGHFDRVAAANDVDRVSFAGGFLANGFLMIELGHFCIDRSGELFKKGGS